MNTYPSTSYREHCRHKSLAKHAEAWGKKDCLNPMGTYESAQNDKFGTALGAMFGSIILFSLAITIALIARKEIDFMLFLLLVASLFVSGCLGTYSSIMFKAYGEQIKTWVRYTQDLERLSRMLEELQLPGTNFYEDNKAVAERWLNLAHTQILAKEERGDLLDADGLKGTFERFHDACTPFLIGSNPKFRECYEKKPTQKA